MSVSTTLPGLRPSRPRRKGEQTARRILDAAEQLFAERGYAATTLRDVAERVDLRIPSLYNHFASKDSLYAAVLRRGMGPVLDLLSEFVEAGGRRSVDSAALVRSAMQLLARHPNLPRLVQHEALAGGDRLTPVLRDWIGPILSRAEQAVATGGVRTGPESVPLIVLAMYNVVVGYFTIAPVFRELQGRDLLSERALAAQTRFLIQLVESLFAEPEDARDAGSAPA